MATKTYKDWFTLDGRLRPAAGVTKKKVEAIRELVDRSLAGSHNALGTLKEALTTSDASLSLAHLVNLNVLPQYDEAPRIWTQIAGTRSVPDFRPAVLYSLVGEWNDGVLGSGEPRHVAPTVPEAAPYPYSILAGEEIAGAGVTKNGFKVRFTFEAFVNDALGFIRSLPDEMLQVALDTEEYKVLSTLIGGVGAGQQLDGGVIPDGTTVPANATLTRASLVQAKIELANRQINGRNIRVTGGYNLLVSVGQGEYARWVINNLRLDGIQDGALSIGVNGYNPLSDVNVIETDYVTGAAWYLLPRPGGTRRPTLDHLSLIGHETAELRVQNLTGTYVGGGAVSPFEGDFDTDSAEFRVRLIDGAVLWTPDQVVYSTGAGGAPTPPPFPTTVVVTEPEPEA